MVNTAITTLHDPDGAPVCNVAFDLSDAQLRADAHALGEVLVERHRGAELDVEGVLALRELTSVRDELDQLAGHDGHATLVMPLARFITLHDALDEWVVDRTGRGWHREVDEEHLPLAQAQLGPMTTLREDALASTLGTSSTA